MKDIFTYLLRGSNDMIADLGCPNSVIGKKDEDNFVSNLSQYQKEHLQIVQVDENYKFGPSGPFQCREKIRFPINVDKKPTWIDVAIVDANIPMLLGNNILKPLEAEIKLFATGNGVIKLGDIELVMKETSGGHYTLKVEELSKLGNNPDSSSYCTKKVIQCEECAKVFECADSLSAHKQCANGDNNKGSILKNQAQSVDAFDKEENCLHKVLSDLNTQLNGKLSRNEKRFVQIMKQFAQIQQVENKIKCEMCENENNYLNNHKICKHGENGDECNLCQFVKANERKLEKPGNGEHIFQTFLSHHEEESSEDQDELNPALWSILLSENDDSGLTEAEEKEILILHRYFPTEVDKSHGRICYNRLENSRGRRV